MLIFISHHAPDRKKAEAVGAALAARRPATEWYIAPQSVAGGAYWVPGLADAVARSDAVLFLAGARIGPWQELEYYEAMRLSRERGGRPRVVPVVMAGQAPGLPFLAQLHQIFTSDPAAPESLAAIERAFEDARQPDSSPAWQRFQPYKGLPALQEADAAFFFGRDDETTKILDLLSRRPDRIITLIGQSGVGKSSLFAAYRELRIMHQLHYANYKLRGERDIFSWSSPRLQEVTLSYSFLMCILAIFLVHLWIAFSVLLRHRFPALDPFLFNYGEGAAGIDVHVGVIWVAIAALAIRALQEGLQPEREIERYRHYRASVRAIRDRFDEATTAAEKFEVMLDMERLSFDEFRNFLRSSDEARFVI